MTCSPFRYLTTLLAIGLVAIPFDPGFPGRAALSFRHNVHTDVSNLFEASALAAPPTISQNIFPRMKQTLGFYYRRQVGRLQKKRNPPRLTEPLTVRSFVALIATIAAAVLSDRRLLGQEARSAADSLYKSLIDSGQPQETLLATLFRAATLSDLRLARAENRTDALAAETEREQRRVFLETAKKIIFEAPKEGIYDNFYERILQYIDFLASTSEPEEQKVILKALNDVLPIDSLDLLLSMTPIGVTVALRCLLTPQLNSLTIEALRPWLSNTNVSDLLQELVLARLSGNNAVVSEIENAFASSWSTEVLLQHLSYSDSREHHSAQVEIIKILSRRSDFTIYDLDRIEGPVLYQLLSDPNSRPAAIEWLRTLTRVPDFVVRDDPEQLFFYQKLRFDLDTHRFLYGERSTTRSPGYPPPLEGGMQSRLLEIILSEHLNAEAFRDQASANDLSDVMTTLQSQKGYLLYLLASLSSSIGVDTRLTAYERLFAQSVSAASDETLGTLVIHDPRLVIALLRMTFRSNDQVAEGAKRALHFIRIDSTAEANRAAQDESLARQWVDIPTSYGSMRKALKAFVLKTGGDFMDTDRWTASDQTQAFYPLVEKLRRVVDSKQSPSQEDRDLMGALAKDFEDDLMAESNPERSHALVRFMSTAGLMSVLGGVSPIIQRKMIDDLDDPTYASETAELLIGFGIIRGFEASQYLWKKFGSRFFAAAAQDTIASDPVLDQMQRVFFETIKNPVMLLPVVIEQKDPLFIKWFLERCGKDFFETPEALVWLVSNVDHGALAPLIDARLEKVEGPLQVFRDELLFKHYLAGGRVPSVGVVSSVWTKSLDAEMADQAVIILDRAATAVEVDPQAQNPLEFLTAFRREIDQSTVLREASLRVMKRLRFPKGRVPVEWVRALLDLRAVARTQGNTRRQEAIDQVLQSEISNAQAGPALESIAQNEWDQTLRAEAKDVLKRRETPSHVGLAGVIGAAVFSTTPQNRVTRRAFVLPLTARHRLRQAA